MNINRFAGLSILLTSFIFPTAPSWASWQHTGAARISTEYDSNPAMTPIDSGDVSRTLFEPSYTLIGRFDEDELRTGVALQIARSSNQTLSQNRDSPSVFVDWLRQIETGEFGFTTKYAEVATRDAGIDATAQIPVDSKRASRILSGRWKNDLTERSTLSADGTYESVSYTGANFVDYVTRSSSFMYSLAWSELIMPYLKVLYADYKPADGGPESRLESATLGLNWRVSDNLNGSMQIGNSRINDTDAGTQGALAIQYTGQQSLYRFNIDRHVSASGLGGFVTVDQASGNWIYNLTELDSVGIDLLLQKNHSSTIDNIRTTTGVWLQHQLNTFWVLRTHYLHNVLAGNGIESASSNILGVALVYTYSDF